MPSQVKVSLVIALLCVAAVLGFVLGSYFPQKVQKDEAAVTCPAAMAGIIESAKGDVYKIEDPDYVEPQSYYLVTYTVRGDEITAPIMDLVPDDLKDEQQDKARQREAWRIFTRLIPAEDRTMVTQYILFTDGGENTLAAVDQTKADLTHWSMEVDIADLQNKDELLFTLVHEYAHLLTLNDEQVAVDEEIYQDPYNLDLLEGKAADCPNYFAGSGCSRPNSYINAFHDRFWVALDAEWKKIDELQYAEDLNPYYAALYNFYLAHQDQFLDDYSTTHPAEDIAEAFAYFVFSPRPAGTTIKDQKILFFYEYPELVELRQSILQGACSIAQ